MPIELTPELQKLVEEDVANGAYNSVDEFVTQAVTELHERERWIADNRAELAVMIEEGWESARRGELMDEGQVRSEMQKLKSAWRAQKFTS